MLDEPPRLTGITGAGSVDLGQQVTLRVGIATVSGKGTLSFWWRKDGVDLIGATAQTYVIPSVAPSDAGTYTAVVTDGGGASVATAQLTVRPPAPPVIVSQARSATADVGASVNFSYAATGSFPRTQQWRKDGVPIPGATAANYAIPAVRPSDAGAYSVVIKNDQGSVTSADTLLVVNPATPVSGVAVLPDNATLTEGQVLTLRVVGIGGSFPYSFQWRKGGTPISGATAIEFKIQAVTMADAGRYDVVVSNVAGSSTSNPVNVTIQRATPITFSSQLPSNVSAAQGEQVNLSFTADGSQPFTIQWTKDGTPLAGQTSATLTIAAAAFSDAGTYAVNVTNGAGTVTSAPAVLTVTLGIAPALTSPLRDQQKRLGDTAEFTALYNSNGGPLRFQWFKDGTPLPGRTSAGLSISPVSESDAGNYSISLTGSAGTVMSAPARLVVLPPTAPVTTIVTDFQRVRLGESADAGQSANPSYRFQWFKDGVAVPGATGSGINITKVTTADLGSYKLVVKGDGGVTTTPPYVLTPQLPGTDPFSGNPFPDPTLWQDVGRVGDTVYFLAQNPLRIDRYDLVTERWLASVPLSNAVPPPTAFLATAEGIFIAYGSALTRRGLDLANETAVLTASRDITRLLAAGDWLFYDGYTGTTPVLIAVHRTTLQTGAISPINYGDIVFSAAQRKGAGVGAGYLLGPASFTLDASGTLVADSSSIEYYNWFPGGRRLFLFPDGNLFANSGGTIFRISDAGYVGSLGNPLSDLVFLSDGTPVVLRNHILEVVRTNDYFPTGRVTLPFLGMRAFSRGHNVFVFGATAASGGVFQVGKIDAMTVSPTVPPAVGIAAGERFSIDGSFTADDGAVHIYSRSKQALLRWSPATRQFLEPLSLRADPNRVMLSSEGGRVLFAYRDGVITEVPLRGTPLGERQVASFGNEVREMLDLGDRVLLTGFSASSSTELRATLGSQGELLSVTSQNGMPVPVAWASATRTLFSIARPDFLGAGVLQSEIVPASGPLPNARAPLATTSFTVAPPVRFTADRAFFVSANGNVGNASLANVAKLANEIADAAWLPDRLITLRDLAGDSEVQAWSRSSFLRIGAIALRGQPVRVLRLGDDRIVAITSFRGFVLFTVLNGSLSKVPPAALMPAPAGIYFGTTTGASGDVAFLLRPDRSGVMLLNLAGSATGLVARDFTIDADGTFAFLGREFTNNQPHGIGGALGVDGKITGTVAGLEVGFTAALTQGTNALAGFYPGTATNGATGGTYAIVGADGRGLAVAFNGTTVVGGAGPVDASGRLVATSTNGTRLSVTLQPDSGRFSASTDRGALATASFMGLRGDLAHTDRLANISTRGRIGGGEHMVAGFVLTGTAPRTVLVRAIGPALIPFGVADAVPNPRVALFQGPTQIAESDDWSAEPRSAEISAAASRLGAFALPMPGRDAALLVDLAPGNYTADISSVDDTRGVALVEVYDANGAEMATTAPRLVNIATRGRVGPAGDVLVAGLVITGNSPKRVLVRVVGPGLSTFGVNGVIADPFLTLMDDTGHAIATNDDWSGASLASATELSFATASVGAFPLSFGSRDAALLVTLQPGNYTAVASNSVKGTATGVALIEIYEVASSP